MVIPQAEDHLVHGIVKLGITHSRLNLRPIFDIDLIPIQAIKVGV
jgi:hypothetical protein